MSRLFLDRKPLAEKLLSFGLPNLATAVAEMCEPRFQPENHGRLEGWRNAWQQLPELQADFDLTSACVGIRPRTAVGPLDHDELRDALYQFHPWRKGPWDFLGVVIDTEWRSNLKWDRLSGNVDFRHKRILDIGCGNGYFGWRMLGSGAEFVLGCDPFLLSIVQFEVFRKYWAEEERHFIIPLSDSELPKQLQFFDLTLSMGVLYHHPSPIVHLQNLHGTLRDKGQLLLETLVLEGESFEVLLPEDRYAKMRNVWFIPTVPMLMRWMRRTGFKNIHLLDVTKTTSQEQRRTEWMTFESLTDFLSPDSPERTIEGYPAPVRAMLLAEKSR